MRDRKHLVWLVELERELSIAGATSPSSVEGSNDQSTPASVVAGLLSTPAKPALVGPEKS
jgi:putative exporter of polyketide antibiotics